MDHVMATRAGAIGSHSATLPTRGRQEAPLRQAVAEFEEVFLAQMLSAMGLGREPKAFGGGFGAEAFQSFLHEAYAHELVRRGGVGIAEALYRQLDSGSHDD